MIVVNSFQDCIFTDGSQLQFFRQNLLTVVNSFQDCIFTDGSQLLLFGTITP